MIGKGLTGFVILVVIGIAVISGPGVGREIAARAMLIRPLLTGNGTAQPIGHRLCIASSCIGSDAAVLDTAVSSCQNNGFCLENVCIVVIGGKPNGTGNVSVLLNQVGYHDTIHNGSAVVLKKTAQTPVIPVVD